MKSLVLSFSFVLFFACTAEKPYYNYNQYTPESYLPTHEIRVYNGDMKPEENFIKIGEVVARGGDYSFRLKKTIEMAKSAGGHGIIVRGDHTTIHFQSQSMLSYVIRFVEADTASQQPGEESGPDVQEEEYFSPSGN